MIGDRPVLNASGHDQELASLKLNTPISELHAEPTIHDQEEFIFVIMLVPNELALELHQLDLLAVQFAHDLRAPIVTEERQLIAEVDFLHH